MKLKKMKIKEEVFFSSALYLDLERVVGTQERVIRGGSGFVVLLSRGFDLGEADRSYIGPSYAFNDLGIRLFRSLK